MLGNGTEAGLYSPSEWDRQLETLDKHQVENHEIQLRLLRDQVSRFNADLFGLREEVAGLASKQEAASELLGLAGRPGESAPRSPSSPNGFAATSPPPRARGGAASGGSPRSPVQTAQASVLDRLQRAEQELFGATETASGVSCLAERLRQLETLVGDAAGRSDKSLESAHWRLDQLGGQLLGAVERSQRSMQALDLLQGRVGTLEGGLQEHRSHQAPLHGRLSSAESLVSEVREEFAQDAASARAKLDQLQLRVAELQEHGLKDAAAARAKMDQLHSRLSEHQEQVLQDAAALRANVDQRLSELQEQGLKARDTARALAEQTVGLELLRDSVAARLEGLEGDVSKRLDQLATDVGAQHKRAADHAKELAGLRHVQTQHASVPERLGYLEEALAESSSQHAEAAQAAHTRLEQVSCRVQACERLGAIHGDSHREHGSLILEAQKSLAQVTALKDRLSVQEQSMEDVGRSVEVLRSTSETLVAELRTRRSVHDRLEERLGLADSASAKRFEELQLYSAKEADEKNARLSELTQRLEDVDQRLGTLHGSHVDHQKQVDKLSKRFGLVQHAFSMPDQHAFGTPDAAPAGAFSPAGAFGTPDAAPAGAGPRGPP